MSFFFGFARGLNHIGSSPKENQVARLSPKTNYINHTISHYLNATIFANSNGCSKKIIGFLLLLLLQRSLFWKGESNFVSYMW
jgi:hypothetical protein